MSRAVPILAASLLALAAVGAALFSASTGQSDSPAGHRPETAGPGAGDRAATAPADGTGGNPRHVAAPPASPRAGRVLKADDAMRELDLIRPSRQKVAEDFTLRMPGGGTFRLVEHRGKTVLMNFWATWCGPCREEMPAMERLYQRHRDRGLVLVAISLDADPAVVPPYVKASKLTFPIALDPKADVANKYGVRALPSSFIIDRHGTMVALALGPREWDNAAAHSLVEALTGAGAAASAASGR